MGVCAPHARQVLVLEAHASRQGSHTARCSGDLQEYGLAWSVSGCLPQVLGQAVVDQALAPAGHRGRGGRRLGARSGGARGAARAVAWCEYLQGHARRLYASVIDRARVAAAVLATKITHGRLASLYRNEWTGLTEPRVVQGALEGLAELGWIRAEAVRARDGGRPTVRFRLNPRLPAGRHDRSRRVPPEASESP